MKLLLSPQGFFLFSVNFNIEYSLKTSGRSLRFRFILKFHLNEMSNVPLVAPILSTSHKSCLLQYTQQLLQPFRSILKKGVLEISTKSFKNTCKENHILVKLQTNCQQPCRKQAPSLLFFKTLNNHFQHFSNLQLLVKFQEQLLFKDMMNYFCNCKLDSYFHCTP